MKRLGFIVLLMLAAVAATAHAAQLVVYSGAGLRPAVAPLLAEFERQTGARVLIEYGGMGQMLARFEQTGRGDVMISGTHFYTDRLIQQQQMQTAWPLAFHGAVVGVYPGSGDKIRRFEDLARPGLRLALGDAQSMALGRTAETIMDASGIGDAIRANVVVRATNVQQLALYVAQGDVDAAIIGVTNALQQQGQILAVPIPSHLYDPERITVGVLATASEPALAAQLVDFMRSDAGLAYFERAGFPMLPEGYQVPAADQNLHHHAPHQQHH